ncbi:MAG: SMP-30/gluconolactonase/LRE family protein [Rhizomicrobium sp.]
MRPATRAALTAGSVILVGALALAARTLSAYGVFTDVTPGFSGICTAVPTANGPGDIAIDETTGLAFISTLDRRAKAAGHPSKTDGLYAISLRDGALHPRKLAGAPSDFHPHGIGLYRAPDGSLTLMAINHRSDGTHSVDMFAVLGHGAATALHETGSIQSDALVSPNAIAAADGSRFYVTNDHASRTHFGRQLDDLFILPRANVLYYDGTVFRPVADRLAYPNGIALSPDGRFVYVAEAYGRRLVAYNRNPFSGGLEEAATLPLSTNLDNLRFDASGRLWVGSHPKVFAMNAFRHDPAKPAPSEIFKVTLANGLPQSANLVYADTGAQIGGASVAAVSGNRMLIGSPLDNHILDCRLAP